jgi:hypothetical protein
MTRIFVTLMAELAIKLVTNWRLRNGILIRKVGEFFVAGTQ